MFLSRKIDIKRCQNYTKTCICNIKQIIINKYATNSKMTISKRSLRNSNQWQCSINVTSLRLYHVTSILHCHWREFWLRDTDVHLPCIRFGIIDRFFCQFLDTRTSERCLTGLVQLLRFSGYSLHPFHFSFTVPLRVNRAFPVLESL